MSSTVVRRAKRMGCIAASVIAVSFLGGCSRERPRKSEEGPSPSASGALPSSEPDPAASEDETKRREVDLLHESDLAIAASPQRSGGPLEAFVDGDASSVWPLGGQGSSVVTLALPPGARAKKLGLVFTRTPSSSKESCEAVPTADKKPLARFPLAPEEHPHPEFALPLESRELRLEISPSDPKQKGCGSVGIAELELTGTLDGGRLPYGIPQVAPVGNPPNFDDQPPTLKTLWTAAPYSSLSALCAAQTKLTAKAAADADAADPFPALSFCEDKGKLKPTLGELAAPFRSVHAVQFGEASSNTPELFAVQSSDGRWYPANVVLATGVTSDLGGAYSRTKVESVTTREGRLWIEMIRHEAVVGAFAEPYDVTARLTVVCSLGEKLLCRQAITAFGEDGPSWAQAQYMQSAEVPFHPAKWRWTRSVSTTPSGQLRFARCEDASGSAGPCAAPGAPRLFQR